MAAQPNLSQTISLQVQPGVSLPEKEYATFQLFPGPYKGPRPLYILTQDYHYYWLSGGVLQRFTIPKGYVTDKASVPQIFWSLGFTPDGLHEEAALVHDYLYQHKGDLPRGIYQVWNPSGEWISMTKHFTRSDCDHMFLQIMDDYGVSRGKATVMYLAVHLCGGFSGGWNW